MFAIIETDCSSGMGKRYSRSPWWASQEVLQCYKQCTANRTIVMGYDCYKHFPMNRFNSNQYYLVLTIRPEAQTSVHKNVRFISRFELDQMDSSEFILVGGYTMFRLLSDKIHFVFRIHLNHTFHECDLFEHPNNDKECTHICITNKSI